MVGNYLPLHNATKTNEKDEKFKSIKYTIKRPTNTLDTKDKKISPNIWKTTRQYDIGLMQRMQKRNNTGRWALFIIWSGWEYNIHKR